MTRRRKAKIAPDPPDLAVAHFDPAPGSLADGDHWSAIEAGSELRVDDSARNIELSEAVFTGADFARRDLRRLHARDARFERCDLSGAILDTAALTRVEFIECRLTGAMFTNAALRDVLIRDCRADLTNWRMTSASYLLLESCALQEADFDEAKLHHTAMLYCDLARVAFRRCELSNVDLHGSQVDDLHDVQGLRGAAIAADQIVPLASALLAAAGISVTDEAQLTGLPPQ